MEGSNTNPESRDSETAATPSRPQWMPKRRRAVMAVIVATLGSFGLGMTLVWSAIALTHLKEDKPFGELSDDQLSLVGSIIYLGALISAPLTGVMISKFGRKYTMLVTAVPCVLGWLLIAFAPNIWMIYLGRFITGYCGGTFTVAVPTYVAEVTEDRIRGTLGTVMILMLVLGIEFTFVIGAFVNWFWLTIAASIVPVVFFIAMLFMPESPRYLVLTRQMTTARKALKWLRRASTKKHIEPEVTQIERSVASNPTPKVSCTSISDIAKPEVLKPVGIGIAMMGFAQFSGMNGIALYTSQVFSKAGTEMDPRYALIVIFGGQALTVLLGTLFLVENFGRKSLLIVSQFVSILGLLGFGYSFLLQVDNKIPEEWAFLPLTSLVVFVVGYNIGIGPLPWLITNEILPIHARELASSVVTFFYWVLSFLAGLSFIHLENILGSTALYWSCAGLTFISILFTFFLIPETRDKSSEQIEKYFSSISSKRNVIGGEEIKDVERQQHQETGFSSFSSNDGIPNLAFQEGDMRGRQ